MRMLRFIIFAGIVVLVSSCAMKQKNAIVIGDVNISAQEARDVLGKFNYATATEEVRGNLLESFINRKIILMEAEEQGLDKDPKFVENIRTFREQSLLKLILDRKLKELSLDIRVYDEEVKRYYEANKEKYAKKKISEVNDEIKLIIFKIKQQVALKNWINLLREKTKIKVNRKLLE